MGLMDSLKDGIGKVKESADEMNQKRLVDKANKISADEGKRCGTCDNFNVETSMCSKHNKEIANPTGADGEYCANWTNFKQKAADFKESYREGKLEAFRKDAHKRCGHCDHYVDGTKMCKNHKKQIVAAFGADGEVCPDWTEFGQTFKRELKNSIKSSLK